MPTLSNNRTYYATHAVAMSEMSETGDLNPVSGVQSVGINTTFNLEQVFQLGQLEIYENIENIPDIEVTLEKVLDGKGLIQHLATPKAAQGATLSTRYNNQRTDVYVGYYADTVTNASGSTDWKSEAYCSGMYLSSISFTLPTDGNCTESVTLVGNDKVWRTGTTPGLTDTVFEFNDNGQPGSQGVNRRQDIVMASSVWPLEVPGMAAADTGIFPSSWDTSDTSNAGFNWASSAPLVHIQSVNISTDLGRTELFELGQRGPYHRFADFPTEVTCAIEVVEQEFGDFVDAVGSSEANVTNAPIFIMIDTGGTDTTEIDLGQKNKLASITSSGGDTGGGNRTTTYNYSNFNRLTVIDSQDPAGATHP